MNYRDFGKTGWRISELSIGTVEIGQEYGIAAPGMPNSPPSEDEATRLLVHAFEQGVNLIDTAPAYGRSESVIGKALHDWKGRVFVATKVSVPPSCASLHEARKCVEESVDRSLTRLGSDCLDLVQIHNATVACLQDGVIIECLLNAKNKGKVTGHLS